MKKKKRGKPPPQITANEAAYHHPPPTHEEIISAYQTSMKEVNVGMDLPTLSYIDLLPKCLSSGNLLGNVAPKFGDFSTLLEAANRLLFDNPKMAIWKCETVTKKISWDKSGEICYELNTMLRHESTFGFHVFIKGLRLWLTKDPHPRGPPQQIGLRNIIPRKISTEKPSRRKNKSHSGGRECDGERMDNMTNDVTQLDTLENLSDTMAKLQETIAAEDPIPGTILTIETDRIKVKEHDQFKEGLDPESTSWSENKSRFRRFTQIIRIFYVEGTSAKEEIGYKVFVPEVSDVSDATEPAKFEPFENLVNRLAAWISANQGTRIVNIQQYDALVKKSYYDVEVCSDSMDDTMSNIEDQRFVRTLRVYYAKSYTVRALPANFLTCRLFLPARTGPETFECMTQTMDRIDAWLRISGLPIYSVETVELPFNSSDPLSVEFDQTVYNVLPSPDKHWITAIRIYFTTPFSEPDPALLPTLPMDPKNGKGSRSCTIL